MNIGIFGGTFDPPHLGHLIIAEAARAVLALDRVVFVPAGNPPHKSRSDISPGWMRLEMVRRAIASNAAFDVDGRELDRIGLSYTVDTVRELKREHPGDQLVLLIGMDNAVDFESWREPEAIFALADVAALRRPGDAEALSGTFKDRITMVRSPLIETSSSSIRAAIRAGASVKYLVPDQVLDFIEQHHLYRSEM
jgi:nicotinate-nucleotide adenylyltransferase